MDKEVIVRVAGAEVECSVMRTEEELALGLQGHNDLSEGEGMLFLFPQPKTPTFWMGKVAFPIDIIGIDENSRITKIVEDAQPGTTSRWTFHRVSAVLEVPGRWCIKNNINVGDQVDALDFPKVTKRKIAVDLNDPKLVMGLTELRVNKGFNAVWPQVFGMVYGTYIGKGGVFAYEGAHQPGMADAMWLRQYAEEQQRPEAMRALPYMERMPGTRHRMKGADGKTLWVTDAELQYFDISKAPDLKGARQRRLEQEMPGETVSGSYHSASYRTAAGRKKPFGVDPSLQFSLDFSPRKVEPEPEPVFEPESVFEPELEPVSEPVSEPEPVFSPWPKSRISDEPKSVMDRWKKDEKNWKRRLKRQEAREAAKAKAEAERLKAEQEAAEAEAAAQAKAEAKILAEEAEKIRLSLNPDVLYSKKPRPPEPNPGMSSEELRKSEWTWASLSYGNFCEKDSLFHSALEDLAEYDDLQYEEDVPPGLKADLMREIVRKVAEATGSVWVPHHEFFITRPYQEWCRRMGLLHTEFMKNEVEPLMKKLARDYPESHERLRWYDLMPDQYFGEPSTEVEDDDDDWGRRGSLDAYLEDEYTNARHFTAGSESYKGINFTPPQGARDAAQAGLNLRKEYGRGGTAVGIARARDIARGAKLSPETMKRMKAFFDRHQKNRGSGSESPPKNGWIAWQLWGGDAGRSWANKVVKQMEARKKKK